MATCSKFYFWFLFKKFRFDEPCLDGFSSHQSANITQLTNIFKRTNHCWWQIFPKNSNSTKTILQTSNMRFLKTITH